VTHILEVMAADPDTCTPAEWDAYLVSVDVSVMSQDQADVHRGLVERYTRRLLREQGAARARTLGLLDARDAASAEAEALSARCRMLNRELLDCGTAVLDARSGCLPEDPRVVRAVAQYDEVAAVLAQTRAELAAANLRAIQAHLDAR
jgi:hypothetical protein